MPIKRYNTAKFTRTLLTDGVCDRHFVTAIALRGPVRHRMGQGQRYIRCCGPRPTCVASDQLSPHQEVDEEYHYEETYGSKQVISWVPGEWIVVGVHRRRWAVRSRREAARTFRSRRVSSPSVVLGRRSACSSSYHILSLKLICE